MGKPLKQASQTVSALRRSHLVFVVLVFFLLVSSARVFMLLRVLTVSEGFLFPVEGLSSLYNSLSPSGEGIFASADSHIQSLIIALSGALYAKGRWWKPCVLVAILCVLFATQEYLGLRLAGKNISDNLHMLEMDPSVFVRFIGQTKALTVAYILMVLGISGTEMIDAGAKK